jgi:hypothetical protein
LDHFYFAGRYRETGAIMSVAAFSVKWLASSDSLIISSHDLPYHSLFHLGALSGMLSWEAHQIGTILSAIVENWKK